MTPPQIENAIKASLEAIDRAGAAVAKERKKLEREIDAARKAREKAEKEGEKIAQEYFEKCREALVESTRKSLLRELARSHLEKGRSVDEICLWLGVEREFVESIIEIMDRRADYYREIAEKERVRLDSNPRLTYQDQGRSGTISFKDDRTKFDMWWEFGTGRTLTFIAVPSPAQWEAQTKLPRDEREKVLHFIAGQVISDKCAGRHSYEIGDSYISIFR